MLQWEGVRWQKGGGNDENSLYIIIQNCQRIKKSQAKNRKKKKRKEEKGKSSSRWDKSTEVIGIRMATLWNTILWIKNKDSV